jgi:hypothetical protein
MKKIIVTIMAITALITAYKYEARYTTTARVIAVTDNGAIVKDHLNHEQWYVEEEGLQLDDTVQLTVNHNYTYNDATDDVLIKVKREF